MAPRAIESLDEPDLTARQFTRLAGAVTALLVAIGGALLLNMLWLPGALLLLAAIPFGMWTRSLSEGVPTTVRLDAAGIHRQGRYAVSLPWNDIAYAGVHPYDSHQVLVVVPHQQVKHWSRTWRNKEQVLTENLGLLPEGGYVMPIYVELAREIEQYIAGHLPGHPGFDPSRLRLPANLAVDDAETSRGIRKNAPVVAPLMTVTPDPLARRQLLVNLALGAIAAAGAVYLALLPNTAGAVAIGLIAAYFAYRAWTAWKARSCALLVAEAGIRRGGPWGWEYAWSAIKQARVEEFAGQTYLVVIRADENALYHRSSTLLQGHPFPANALISPVPAHQRAELSAAISAFSGR